MDVIGQMKGWNLPFDGERTQFRAGDPNTRKAGQKGGIRSGERRRLKADLRKHMHRMVADAVYCEWLTDVTVDELKDFIQWRGQVKRKDTLLAKAMLEDSEEAEEDRSIIREFLEGWTRLELKPHPRKDLTDSLYRVSFKTSMELNTRYDKKRWVISDLIDAIATALEMYYEAETKR